MGEGKKKGLDSSLCRNTPKKPLPSAESGEERRAHRFPEDQRKEGKKEASF